MPSSTGSASRPRDGETRPLQSFLYDRTARTALLVSRALGSAVRAGNRAVPSQIPVVSPDGRYVVFASQRRRQNRGLHQLLAGSRRGRPEPPPERRFSLPPRGGSHRAGDPSHLHAFRHAAARRPPGLALRFPKSQTRSGTFTIPLGTDGTFDILPFVAGNGTVQVLVEVTGYSN